MADSIRKRILAAVKSRLQQVTVANGFNTDAGLALVIGVLPKLGEDSPDAAIAVAPQEQTPVPLTPIHVGGDWPIEIIAIANASANLEDPWFLVEDILADIQRAMELEDRTFGSALISPLDMEVGSTRVFGRESASEQVAVSQTYTFRTQRVWGNPGVRR
jgi:hypothetical protein